MASPAPPRGTDPRRAETRRTLWEVVDAGPFWTGLVAAAYLLVVVALTALIVQPVVWFLPEALRFQLQQWSGMMSIYRTPDAEAAIEALRNSSLLGVLPWVIAGTIVVLAVVQVLSAFAGGKRARLVRRMGAYPPLGPEYASMRNALMDVTLAAGLGTPPPLYMIDTPAVNAALLAQSADRCAVVVTYGFARHMSMDDQRAVFAHLLGRLNYRRTPAVLLLAALLDPIERMNVLDRGWRRAADAIGGRGMPTGRSLVLTVIGVMLCFVVGPLIALVAFPVVLTLLLVALLSAVAEQVFHRAYCALADFGDAEGMMLLKDPPAMLGALERTLDEENGVVYAGTALPMFYCWPKEAPPSVEDPERRRIGRLRHTLGAIAHNAPDAGRARPEES